MKKDKVDEIVEKVLKAKPNGLIQDWNKGYDQALRHCREDLKQAISSGVLCVPLTVEGMYGAAARGYCTLRNEQKVLDPYLLEDICKSIHTAQTKKPTE